MQIVALPHDDSKYALLKEKGYSLAAKSAAVIALEAQTLRGVAIFTGDTLDVFEADQDAAPLLLEKLMKRTLYTELALAAPLRSNAFLKQKSTNGIVNNPYRKKPRLIDIGTLANGASNAITDVPGVRVGHDTIREGDIQTGVTAIIPSSETFLKRPLAAVDVFNGFTKCIGLPQIEVSGALETPILLTNTLNAPKVADALIDVMIDKHPEIGRTHSTVSPLVLECNDGYLNDIQRRPLSTDNVYSALRHADAHVAEGSVGAGTGMRTHGFSAGIGTASRQVRTGESSYVVGVLVNANFHGDTAKHLRVNGRRIFDGASEKEAEHGSINIVIATDAPLEPRQLKHLAKRSIIGIGRSGSIVSHGSGDVAIAFTTANTSPRKHAARFDVLDDAAISPLYQGVIEASEEAVLNALFRAGPIKGYRGDAHSVLEYLDRFEDLFTISG